MNSFYRLWLARTASKINSKSPQDIWRGTLLVIFINSIIWVLLYSYARHYLDTSDMIENYAWGISWELGNNKHPPLFGWIVAAWFEIFPTNDNAYYLLTELNLAFAFILLALALRQVMSPPQVFIAIVLTMLFSRFGFDAGYKYNANSAQLPFLTGFLWACLSAIQQKRNIFWVWSGFFVSAAILCKYSAAILIIAISMGIWIILRPKFLLILKGALIATIISIMLVSPHIWWEVKHHWPSLHYMHETHVLELDKSFINETLNAFQTLLNFSLVPILFWGIILFKTQNPDLAVNKTPRLGLLIYVLCLVLTLIVSKIQQLIPIYAWFIVPSIFLGWALVDLSPKATDWYKARIKLIRLLPIYVILLVVLAVVVEQRYKQFPAISGYEIQQHIASDVTSLAHTELHEKIGYAVGSFPLGYAVSFYSKDHPQSLYGVDVDQSPWVNVMDLYQSSKVVVCGFIELGDPREDSTCEKDALTLFGMPDKKRLLEYPVYDSIQQQIIQRRFTVLLYSSKKERD